MIPMSSSLSAMPVQPSGETCNGGIGTTGQRSTTSNDDECDLGARRYGVVAEAGSKQQQSGDSQSDEDGGGQNGFEGGGRMFIVRRIIATRAGNRRRVE